GRLHRLSRAERHRHCDSRDSRGPAPSQSLPLSRLRPPRMEPARLSSPNLAGRRSLSIVGHPAGPGPHRARVLAPERRQHLRRRPRGIRRKAAGPCGGAGMTAPPLPSPYRGLAPFEDSETDARLFFGRERERTVILANLMASRLTVLYGASGVGKSSLLGA